MFKYRALIVAFALPATFAAGSVTLAAANETDPAAAAKPHRPAWVGDGGVVSINNMPEQVPIVDRTGRLVIDAHGKPKMHRTDVDRTPPKGPRPGV
jgi:hypothetical protein